MTEPPNVPSDVDRPASKDPEPPARRSLHWRIYHWVLHWAYTPYALPALVLLSFAESSFFPIPPDVLLIALVLGNRRRGWWYAFWCSVASVLGGMAGYGIGFGLWESVKGFFFEYVFSEAAFDRVAALYGEHGFWVVFTAGFTPIPYKVITISAGVFHATVPFGLFVIASAISRSARFFLVTALLIKFGPPIQTFIEKRLGLITILFSILLIGGFVLIKYVL